MGKTIVSGGARASEPVNYIGDPVFANNDWVTIIEACETNRVPDAWAVGDQKAMTINGTSYLIDIIGKNHDTYTVGGIAPLTFQMHDCYMTDYYMNDSSDNSGGWESCNVRNTHLPSILTLMPNEVQSSIKKVNKLTSAGDKSTAITTTTDKLFLLSEVEIFGSILRSVSGEGFQYDYYKAGNSKIKDRYDSVLKDFTPCDWWQRSPSASSDKAFCYVGDAGTADHAYANSPDYLAFAFCF